MRLILGFAAAGLLMLSGCAYHVGTGDRELPGGYRAIAVPVFKNLTAETGVEVFFTNSIKRELERSRLGRISDPENAQVVLEGSVDSISYVYSNPTSDIVYTPRGSVLNLEYRILLRATMRLRRRSDQRVLWESSFSGERTYLSPRIRTEQLNSANALYNNSARYQNIQVMAVDMMVEAHDRMTESF